MTNKRADNDNGKGKCGDRSTALLTKGREQLRSGWRAVFVGSEENGQRPRQVQQQEQRQVQQQEQRQVQPEIPAG